MPYEYKLADQDWEFELISRLNYCTFVEEIPQHRANEEGTLIDAYHKENKYFICLNGRELVGMIAVRDKRPFSLDHKLGNVNNYFPPDSNLIETRLLSVAPGHRFGAVNLNLMVLVADYGLHGGYHAMIISGTTRQSRLYNKLGFLPFGPLVGSGGALFQPMYNTPERFRLFAPPVIQQRVVSLPEKKVINFLPGPVEHHPSVTRAMGYPAISHRNFDYLMLLNRVHWRLTQLSGARFVQVLSGTGTLANDVVAGQLLQLRSRGLILTNGEFGDRLISAAQGFGLEYEVVRADWGANFNYAEVIEYLKKNPGIKWLWMVHLETSTGILNTPEEFEPLTRNDNLKVCIDCISSFGNTSINLSWVYAASSVSGKGLSAHTGLSMVFYNHRLIQPVIQLPNYLNLYNYQECDGIPYSSSSNLLHSLSQALENLDVDAKSAAITKASCHFAMILTRAGLSAGKVSDNGSIILNIAIPQREIGRAHV